MKRAMAIIGYGFMGKWHADNVKEKIDGLYVKGIYDVREEAYKKAKEDGLLVYDSVEELLADQEVTLIIVATPNNFHMQYAIRGMEAGKDVICEKPVTMNAEELEKIIICAKQNGRLFSIHQNRRWDKDFVTVKKVLESGIIGVPYFIESRVQGSRGAMFGWRGHKVNGGGMVLDWGVHLIDQLLYLIDSMVVSVDAHLFNLYSDEVEDNIKIILRFANGYSAVCEMSTNCLINQPRWHICCTEGTMVVDNWGQEGKLVKLKPNAEMEWSNDIVYTSAGPTRTMAPRPAYTTEVLPLPEVDPDWSDYYKNILQVLDGKEELKVTPEQALRVMKVIDKIFESQKLGYGIRCEI